MGDVSAQGRLILAAEDDETKRLVVQRRFALLGYAVEVAKDGAEALELSNSKAYGLLLTDCHMLRIDGFEPKLAVRESGQTGSKNTSIVALIANALVNEAERCLNAEMDDYLAKPARLKKLGDTLARRRIVEARRRFRKDASNWFRQPRTRFGANRNPLCSKR